MTRPRHYVFAGGGSGGHLTPALAVADQLLAEDSEARVTFLTSGRPIDEKVMQNSPVTCHERCAVVRLSVTQPPSIRPSGWTHTVSLWTAFRQCSRLLKSQGVDLVVGSGAFASVPGLLAAHRAGIPTVAFEANVTPGRVNRWWASRAALRLAGFPGGFSTELHDYEHTGMPLTRSAPINDIDRRQILVIGGSQGSQRLNTIAAKALSETLLPDGWRVLHQTGANQETVSNSSPATDQITATEFVPNVMEQMEQSAFVISRAGAVTIGEMAATGCPAILIPLSSAAHSHQQSNARCLADYGAAIIVDEMKSQAAFDLAGAITDLIADSSVRRSMSEAMRSLHRDDASVDIARRLKHLVETRAAKAN